jgi:V8-like Glu-specific endopeptidase
MIYPTIVQPETKSTTSLKLILCSIVSVTIVLAIIIIGIGLGVGLGIGLRKSSNDESSSSETSDVLSPPIVNCIYVNSSICGCAAIQPKFLSSRIIDGYNAVDHSWPWTVILYYNNSQRCDGFLVTYQHVITAAHCVFGFETTLFQVYAGVESLSSSIDRQIRNVSQIQIHPDYSSTTFVNDIAILKLSSSLNITTTVGLCCLPPNGSTLPFLNEHAVIVGWGRTSAINLLSIPDKLQQAVVQIQGPSLLCNASANSDRQFCAGYDTTDTCQGDSGGPLMTSVNNSWTCTGIVSYGQGCGMGGYYTRVSYYRTFIDNTILTL